MPPPSSPNDRPSNSRFNLNSINLFSRYLNHNSNLQLNQIPSELRNISMDSEEDEDYVIHEVDEEEDEDIDEDIDEDDVGVGYIHEDDYNSEIFYPNIDEVMNQDSISDSDDSQDPSSLLNLYNMMYSDFPFGQEDDGHWHSQIQSSERLLLSSARHNHTNSNTLINTRRRGRYPSSHYRQLMLSTESIDSTPPVAISLTRQNAIRRKNNGNANSTSTNGSAENDAKKLLEFLACANEEAHALFNDIEKVIQQINISQISPIFIMTGLKSIRLKKHVNKDNLFHNLDDYMDDFLQARLKGDIWKIKPSKQDKKRKLIKDSPFKSNKKQKLFDANNHDLIIYDSPKINNIFQNLANNQKDAILDIQYCSIFTAGSCYSMKLPNSPELLTDLKFTNVNYFNKSIEGLFNLYGGSSKGLFDKIILFKKFLLGNFNYSQQHLPKHNSLFRKINILQRLCRDSNILSHLATTDTSHKINLSCVGSMIDFKNNDLRFLLKLYKSDRQRIKSFHSSRLKANGVRVQLYEWMKLEPFVQFKQSFFLTYLNRLHLNLKNFPDSKAPDFIKQETIHRAKVFKSSISELTKGFGIDFPASHEQDCLPSASKRDCDFFLDDWKKSLAERLSDQLTDSTTTLLNIQLNYILFTMEMDLPDFLEQSIQFILNSCSDKEHIAKYKKIYHSVLQDEAKFEKGYLDPHKFQLKQFKQAIILCSLNRKTGEMQIHNTLPFLNSRNLSPLKSDYILSRRRGIFPTPDEDSLINDFESFSSDNDEPEPEPEVEQSGGYTFRPINEKATMKNNAPTELFGHIKRHDQGESFGGGHPVFQSV